MANTAPKVVAVMDFIIVIIIFTLGRCIPEGYKELRWAIQKLGMVIRPCNPVGNLYSCGLSTARGRIS